jgi:hypothetical protein
MIQYMNMKEKKLNKELLEKCEFLISHWNPQDSTELDCYIELKQIICELFKEITNET